MKTMEIVFPGGDRVDARIGPYTISTDQGGSAPAPFHLFLASIGTCTGIYIARFCRQRGIPTEGLRIVQRPVVEPSTGHVLRLELDVQLPPELPERYHEAVIRAAKLCTVKKHLERPPEIVVRPVIVGTAETT